MTRRQEQLMGREVGQIAARLSIAMGCQCCGVGKAIDIVGQRWGLVPYDWAGAEAKRFGHVCKNTTWAKADAVQAGAVSLEITDAEKNRRLAEIAAGLEAWARSNTDMGLLGDEHMGPDQRLPVERDDDGATDMSQ